MGQRSNDPQRAFLLPLADATVDLKQGALRLSHALDFDRSPRGAGASALRLTHPT